MLISAVDSVFERTGASFGGWRDPHEDGLPTDDEYSRLTNPDKWLILGARVDAWIETLVRLNAATLEPGAVVHWEELPELALSQVDRVAPLVVGALPLTVARSWIDDVTGAGVTIGVGDPAVRAATFPACGCDACDNGSNHELGQLDEWLEGVVSGVFRRLRKGKREIVVHNNNGWSGTNLRRRDNVASILQNSKGWDELSGVSWLDLP